MIDWQKYTKDENALFNGFIFVAILSFALLTFLDDGMAGWPGVISYTSFMMDTVLPVGRIWEIGLNVDIMAPHFALMLTWVPGIAFFGFAVARHQIRRGGTLSFLGTTNKHLVALVGAFVLYCLFSFSLFPGFELQADSFIIGVSFGTPIGSFAVLPALIYAYGLIPGMVLAAYSEARKP